MLMISGTPWSGFEGPKITLADYVSLPITPVWTINPKVFSILSSSSVKMSHNSCICQGNSLHITEFILTGLSRKRLCGFKKLTEYFGVPGNKAWRTHSKKFCSYEKCLPTHWVSPSGNPVAACIIAQHPHRAGT